MEQRRRSWIPIPPFSKPGSPPNSATLPSQSNGGPPSSPGGAEDATSSQGSDAVPPAATTPGSDLDRLILTGLERTGSISSPSHRQSGSFGKMAFASMMSSLSLTRTNTNDKDKDKERGRQLGHEKRGSRSSSHVPASDNEKRERSSSRARSQSPFSFRRFKNREREASPTPEAVPLSNSELDVSEVESIRTRTAFQDDPESGDDTGAEYEGDSDEEDWSDREIFDPITERNTERNAITEPVPGLEADAELDHDPLGEGVNVVVPPEPYFPSTLNSSGGSFRKRNPKRKKSIKHEQLPLDTSRPMFQRDRCTIIMTQGDPQGSLNGRRKRRYVAASDMSEESRYAVEWGIGTVLRDGDEMLIVTVMENEAKVDPQIPNASDRAGKLRSQQERQAMAYILVRQATQLLQRTRLNVRITCQSWHAKNSRHMLLDIVDYFEPMMLIVGSRGLGQLQGILLGSTSHYLIQKCSVPVMVARRRLKRPPKKAAHLAKNRVHVKLAEAGIDRVAGKVDEDVKEMREQIEKDDDRRRDGLPEEGSLAPQQEEDEGDSSGEDSQVAAEDGQKVAG